MIVNELEKAIQSALKTLGIEHADVHLEHPGELSHGDYSTNVALAYAKELRMKPKEVAEMLVKNLKIENLDILDRVDIAGPGFINFHLTRAFFADALQSAGSDFGKNGKLAGKKVMVEYTDPNPFKSMHIGHLMSNAIGESIARIVGYQGAEVKRANYQGDIGLHVAKAVWAFLHAEKKDFSELALGACYVRGNEAFESDESAKAEIQAINTKLYERSDTDINEIYDSGKKLSLEAFDAVYEKLGTVFDFFFFESEVAGRGVELVRKHVGDVFELSDGATVFKGERYDPSLHTRVFLNSKGLPTYEAKELGLAQKKEEVYPFDISLTITGNEIREYFKVLRKAMELVMPELQGKIRHIPHGMLRLPSGKMSSRTGKVITGQSLIEQVKAMVQERVKDRDMGEPEKERLAEVVAIGAIKYSILRQAIGGDIIFDFEKSISFEGDSGPYLQYSYVRAKSVLEKAKNAGVAASVEVRPQQLFEIERLLYRFPEVVERAGKEYQPHYIATFLIELAGAFNSWYAQEQIVSANDPSSPYKVALTRAFSLAMLNGLFLLGISVPDKM